MGTCIPVPATNRWLRQLFLPRSSGSAHKQRESVFKRLPLDIIHHIHSLLPVKDAARAACVSRVFLRSWRCYSNLTLSRVTLGLTSKKFRDTHIFLINIVDRILEKHSGIGLEIFGLDLRFCESINTSYLDRWIQKVAHSGIQELSLVTPICVKIEYNFPCSVLCDEAAASSIQSLDLASSIQSLDLDGCTFRPTAPLGCLRRLRRLRLCSVDITDEGLEHLLSKSSALEQMDIICCNKIISLRILCTLQKLTFLKVGSCHSLQSIDINAPKLSTLHYVGTLVIDISVADPWQLKDVSLSCYDPYQTLSLALTRLPAFANNVERLDLFSFHEKFNPPMLVSNFPCLRILEINIQTPLPAFSFDVLSLVSFLDASPALDSFILHVGNHALRHDDSFAGGDNANYLRSNPPCRHDRLRQVMITGFRSNKNLIQFVIYILESAPLLECLTLDTTSRYASSWCIGKMKRWSWMGGSCIADVKARKAVKAANRYIRERVPSDVRFLILEEPCSLCNIRTRW